MLDRYHSERTGTNYENQSATVFIIPNHGSEVLNRSDQRVFFFPRSGSVSYRSRQRKKKPSGTQGRKGETAYAKYNFRVLFIIKLARDALLFPWAASYIVVEFKILSFNFNKFVEMDYFKHICFSEISISKTNKINFCC